MPIYTAIDKRAAVKVADASVKIKSIHKLYDKAPHLASWLNLEIRKVTQSDFSNKVIFIAKVSTYSSGHKCMYVGILY